MPVKRETIKRGLERRVKPISSPSWGVKGGGIIYENRRSGKERRN